jgi:hypothetical protein
MTPNDVPGPIVTAESLLPWLLAIAPAVEPVRALPPRPAVAPAAEPLRSAA